MLWQWARISLAHCREYVHEDHEGGRTHGFVSGLRVPYHGRDLPGSGYRQRFPQRMQKAVCFWRCRPPFPSGSEAWSKDIARTQKLSGNMTMHRKQRRREHAIDPGCLSCSGWTCRFWWKATLRGEMFRQTAWNEPRHVHRCFPGRRLCNICGYMRHTGRINAWKAL